jgi:hypothetical protein
VRSTPQKLKICPKCGRGYLPASKECGTCGIPLSSEADIELDRVRSPPPTLTIVDAPPPAKRLPDKLKVCPQCGVSVSAILTVCPECKTRLPLEPDIHIQETIGLEPEFAGGDRGISLASIFAATTLVALGCGLAAIQIGLGIFYMVVILPALAVTWYRIRQRGNHRQGIPWSTRAWSFVESLGIVLGVLALTAAVLAIALAIVCTVVAVMGGFR